MVRNEIKKFKRDFSKLSDITKFRLENLFLVVFLFGLLTPLITSFKGIYLHLGDISAPTILSIFFIISSLIGLLNDWVLENFNLTSLFKGVILFHTVYIFVLLIYFIDPTVMMFIDMFLGMFDMLLFTAYSIALGNFVAYFENDKFQIFQNLRNKILIISAILGSSISTLINYFFSDGTVILIFILGNMFFIIYLLKNINIYKDYDYAYMFRYYRKKLKAERE